MTHIPNIQSSNLPPRTVAFRRLCAHSVKLARHTERPGVAAVTLADICRSEIGILICGGILILALIIEVSADIAIVRKARKGRW